MIDVLNVCMHASIWDPSLEACNKIYTNLYIHTYIIPATGAGFMKPCALLKLDFLTNERINLLYALVRRTLVRQGFAKPAPGPVTLLDHCCMQFIIKLPDGDAEKTPQYVRRYAVYHLWPLLTTICNGDASR